MASGRKTFFLCPFITSGLARLAWEIWNDGVHQPRPNWTDNRLADGQMHPIHVEFHVQPANPVHSKWLILWLQYQKMFVLCFTHWTYIQTFTKYIRTDWRRKKKWLRDEPSQTDSMLASYLCSCYCHYFRGMAKNSLLVCCLCVHMYKQVAEPSPFFLWGLMRIGYDSAMDAAIWFNLWLRGGRKIEKERERKHGKAIYESQKHLIKANSSPDGKYSPFLLSRPACLYFNIISIIHSLNQTHRPTDRPISLLPTYIQTYYQYSYAHTHNWPIYSMEGSHQLFTTACTRPLTHSPLILLSEVALLSPSHVR